MCCPFKGSGSTFMPCLQKINYLKQLPRWYGQRDHISTYRSVLWFQICIYNHHLTLSHFNTCSLTYWNACCYRWRQSIARPEELKMKVVQSCWTLGEPMDYTVHGIIQVRILELLAFPLSMGSSNPEMGPKSPKLWLDSLSDEPKGKPKNTGMGSLSLLQQNFWTQESNQDLQNWRWILSQLN